jgi:type IV pilus assembly protein PilF
MNARFCSCLALSLVIVPLTLSQTGCVASGQRSIGASEDLQEAATVNFNLGVSYFRQGNYELARDKLEKSIDQDPSLPAAHYTIALVYENLREYRLAETHYARAVKLEPNNASAQNSYGVFLCRRLQRPRDAQKYFRAAADNPRYATPEAALTNAGVCLLQAPDVEAAEAYFREALQRNQRFPDALLQMTELSFANGKYLQARAFLERSEAVVPSAAWLLWLGYQIENELGDEPRAKGYALRLKDRFPTSEEAQKLVELERNE